MSEATTERKLDFKIGMVAPRKAGKTSLMSAIFHEMKKKLSGNRQGIQYWASDTPTQTAITRALAEFSSCTSSDDIFKVPELRGTEDASNYKFAFMIPTTAGTQRLNIDIMDYPGGMLGLPEFESEIREHLNASSVLLVPIPADILMEWKRTNGVNNEHDINVNIASRTTLRTSDVVDIVKDWAKRRVELGKTSLLIFVPIRCEAYFDDNGGTRDESETLHEAVKELYIDPLNFSDEEKAMIQVESHAVDTYGIVELRDISLVQKKNGQGELVSNFRKRLNMGNDICSKGALEVLGASIRFHLNGYAKKLGVEREEMEWEIAGRNFLTAFWVILFGDKKKKVLVEQIKKYDGVFRAMAAVSRMMQSYPARQKVINNLPEVINEQEN